jgi:hypothetical protein
MKPVIFATCLLLAFPCLAAQRWPKEIVDSAQAHCAAMMANDAIKPAPTKAAIATYCTCMINGIQGAVSIEDFQQMATVTPEQAAQLPAAKVVKDVAERCSSK